MLGGAGDSGAEPGSTERFLKLELFVLIIVMLRVTFISPLLLAEEALTGGDDRTGNELYFRSLPSPVSGMGPASVSSQSLWRNPITREIRFSRVTTVRGLKSKQFFIFVFSFCWTSTRTTVTERGKGSETQREDIGGSFYFLGFFPAMKLWFGVLYRGKLREKNERIRGWILMVIMTQWLRLIWLC